MAANNYVTLNYFFRCDSYDTQLLLSRGFFENHKTRGNYGKAIYLTNLRDNNLNGKSVILNVDLRDIKDLLFVDTVDNLLKHYIFPSYTNAQSEFDKTGLTPRFGQKYILPYIVSNNFNGLRIVNENLLILYNYKNVKIIRLYDEELKTLRIYSAPLFDYSILYGDDQDVNNVDLPLTDENSDIIIWGDF